MKVALLAGGKGTRFMEETLVRPKPMITIGGHPILWHIMQRFHACGFADFTVATGFKADYIANWFEQTRAELSDDGASPYAALHDMTVETPDTGLDTNTGGRIKALGPLMGDAPFLLAWGDGLSTVDFRKVAAFHADHGRLATMVVVHPPARFGHVTLEGDSITAFAEKPARAEGWINGGMFVLSPQALDYIEGASTQFEKEPLENLARDGQLMAYRHDGFWQCMDTLHDRLVLEELWESGRAPWFRGED